MTLIALVVLLLVIGVVLYLINLIPMDNTIRVIIRVLVILFVVLWLLQGFGVLNMGPSINFHR